MSSSAPWNPESAERAIQVAATIVLIDVPRGAHFGIDALSWTVGERFKGVKLLPPGIHFLWVSIPNKEGGMDGPRLGFFFFAEPKEIIVRKWNVTDETWFSPNQMDPEEVERYEHAVKTFELDSYLGAYPIESFKKWRTLSCFISRTTLQRIFPKMGGVSTFSKPLTPAEQSYLDRVDSNRPQSEQEFLRRYAAGIPMDTEEEQTLVNKIVAEEIEKPGPSITESSSQNDDGPNFVSIPKRFVPSGATPAEITRYNFDKSAILEDLIRRLGSDSELLGEFQMSFLVFYLAQNYDGFEQWKALIEVFCRSERALNDPSHSKLFSAFILTLSEQIQEISTDFFEDIVSGNNFLLQSLKEFFSILDRNKGISKEAKKGADSLKKKVEKHFEMSFSVEEANAYGYDDEDEELPSIANLDELREMGLSDAEIRRLLRMSENE